MPEPIFQFRGIWTPAEIILLVTEGKLTTTDAFFLAVVDGLCEARGIGCWATNRHLAKLVGCKNRNVQYMIGKLVGMGLISVSQEKSRRILKTTWNTPTQPMQSVAYPRAMHCTGPSSLSHRERDSVDNRNDETSQQFLQSEQPMARFEMQKLKPKESKTTDFDIRAAEKLHEVVTTKRNRRQAWSKKGWADEVRILRGELLKDAEGRIDRALAWYEAHHKRKDAPHIDSAAGLRRHFNWLEDKVRKETSSVVISDAAKKVAVRLRMLNWPKDSDSQLEQTIQVSIDAYRGMSKKWNEIKKTTKLGTPYHFFIHYQLAKFFHSPDEFAYDWLKAIHNRIAKWDDWNGELLSLAFDVESKQFQKQGAGWAASADTPKSWATFMEDLRG